MSTQNDTPEWLSLDQGESILWSGNPTTKSIAGVIMFSVIIIIGVPIFWKPLLGIVVGVMFGAVLTGFSFLHLKNTEYVLTSKNVYEKTGVLSTNVTKVGLSKVQDTGFSQGVFGNVFDYGNVDISTAGGSGDEITFSAIPDYKKVKDRINREIDKYQSSQTHQEKEQVDSEKMDEIIEAAKETRESTERVARKLYKLRSK